MLNGLQFFLMLSKEEGRILALYLYINFAKLCWYKPDTFENFNYFKSIVWSWFSTGTVHVF